MFVTTSSLYSKKGAYRIMNATKPSYRIPADLNANFGDLHIALQTKDGTGLKPLPIKVILSGVGSVVVLFWLISNTFIGDGSLLQIILFSIVWMAFTFVMISYDTTKRMKAQLLFTLFDYLPRPNRRVILRKSNPANEFLAITKIEKINPNGLVEYIDATYGYFYRITGAASILLFEADKEAIVSRVDSFFRKISPTAELTFITVKEPQKVYRQEAALARRFKKLTLDDAELNALAQEQYATLKDYVGKEFKSIHQYLLVKADNKEALTLNKNILQSEIENSTHMLKQCVPLFEEDIVTLLSTIYRNGGM